MCLWYCAEWTFQKVRKTPLKFVYRRKSEQCFSIVHTVAEKIGNNKERSKFKTKATTKEAAAATAVKSTRTHSGCVELNRVQLPIDSVNGHTVSRSERSSRIMKFGRLLFFSTFSSLCCSSHTHLRFRCFHLSVVTLCRQTQLKPVDEFHWIIFYSDRPAVLREK